MVKGAPGFETDTAQRRLAFTLWVHRHVAPGGRAPAATPDATASTAAPIGAPG